jgi:hypothetical protein
MLHAKENKRKRQFVKVLKGNYRHAQSKGIKENGWKMAKDNKGQKELFFVKNRGASSGIE